MFFTDVGLDNTKILLPDRPQGRSVYVYLPWLEVALPVLLAEKKRKDEKFYI